MQTKETIRVRIRRWLDGLLLSDHEWKKKYCPTLYWAMTNPEAFHEAVRKANADAPKDSD